ncbi:MAG TPA: histidine ammonia-lyase [Thermoanaerobaculia bacterium]|nr:histidine ammonia-lyase [Thermoanaerobaculia bacterium]
MTRSVHSRRRRIPLSGDGLSLADLEAIAAGEAAVSLAPAARRRVGASRRIVDRLTRRGEVSYGITTGFGRFSDVVVPKDRLAELQRNLVRSHAAGVGAPLAPRFVRAMIALRANTLAKGFSGIRVSTVEALLAMLRADVLPVVPEQGSVGASGDLAPLAHLALGLIGEGDAFYRGRRMRAAEALRRARLSPVALGPKEGLALINGVQMSCAVGGLALARALRLAKLADLAGAMSLDASRGSDVAFDRRIIAARPHPGAIASAANLRRLIAGSAVRESHRNCGKVQDNYALRCMPQVHGAVRDGLSYARRAIEVEMNSASDNPMVFATSGAILSGGNFHGAPVAAPLDLAAIVLTDLASISERRLEKLVNPSLSGLPGFLTEEGGVQSGFMLAQVTAAALTSECKTLSHPASVDSIPTGAAKEDHVSMSPIAARKFAAVVDNVTRVLGIEILAACQALDFLRPLRSSAPIEEARRIVRRRVRTWTKDRFIAPDLEAGAELAENGFVDLLEGLD